MRKLKSAAYGHGLGQLLKKRLASCAACLTRQTLPVKIPVTPIVSSSPFELFIADTTELPRDPVTGHNRVLNVLDSYTKYAWSFPMSSKHAATVARCFEQLFRTERAPTRVLTDNGTEFVAKEVESVFRQHNVKHVTGAVYHPQTQGQVERFNRTLKRKLATYRSKSASKKEWSQFLEDVVFDYNNTTHSSTGAPRLPR